MDLEIEGRWGETFLGGDSASARYHVALTQPKVFTSAHMDDAGALQDEDHGPCRPGGAVRPSGGARPLAPALAVGA